MEPVYVFLMLTCILVPPMRCQETQDNHHNTNQSYPEPQPTVGKADHEAHPTDPEAHATDPEAHATDPEAHPTDPEAHPTDPDIHLPDLEDPKPDQEDPKPDQEDHQPDQEDHQPDHVVHPADHEAHPPSHGPGHWSYTDETDWSKGFPDCGGRAQSPINVDTQKTTYDSSLKEIQLSGYDVSPGQSLKLKNNGHTVVLKLPDNLKVVQGLPHTYVAAQLHFHWGSHASPGSEHTVNGQKFPGEIHVVHYNSQYESLDAAVAQPGGLAVLAAFIQEGPEDNAAYQHLLDYLDKVQESGQSTDIPGFDIRGLLPQRLDRYYRYNGSLTTPPCFQSVNWTIFNQTISLSADQLDILEDTIHHDHGDVLQMNYREPQSLNGRLVLSSFRAPVGGRRAPLGTPASPIIPPDPEDSSSNNAQPGAHGADDQTLSTGDMLAILFGVLFAVTAVAFFVYVRKNQRRNKRSSDTKPSVMYKAATSEENEV